jgi:hypothetical protein
MIPLFFTVSHKSCLPDESKRRFHRMRRVCDAWPNLFLMRSLAYRIISLRWNGVVRMLLFWATISAE